MRAHKEHRPAVTIALYPHSEPLRYGLALCGRDHCVHSFIEKPDWEHVVTNLVNTGVYIVSPKAMELVPEGAVFDFAKDLFPALLDRNEKLLGCPLDGYWCDIGTPKSYYQCCVDALDGKLNVELTGGFEKSPTEGKNMARRENSCTVSRSSAPTEPGSWTASALHSWIWAQSLTTASAFVAATTSFA